MSREICVLLALLLGCRGRPVGAPPDTEMTRLVDSLRPTVERATGLAFRAPTASALRSKEEVRTYLLAQFQKEFPPARQLRSRPIQRQPRSLFRGRLTPR